MCYPETAEERARNSEIVGVDKSDKEAGPSVGTATANNDAMFGGATENGVPTGASGVDLFGEPAFQGMAAGVAAKNAANPAVAAPATGLPSLPSFNETAAPQTSSDMGMTSPTDMNSAMNDPQMNARSDIAANLDSKSMSDVSPEGALGGMGSPAGAPGSEQNSPNAVGGMVGATGMATGQDSGQHGSFGGGTAFGGGSGDGAGGNGSPGANGVGNSNDAGSGTPGAGQSGESGQWMVGTEHTGDDGDEMMDEAVDGMVHENEAVLPRPMRNDIGEDILAEAIGLYQDTGLTPRERKIMLKDLFGEWAASK